MGVFRPSLVTLFLPALLGAVCTACGADAATHPRLIVTSERRAVWSRMRADYEANRRDPKTLGGTWFGLIKEAAEARNRYGDNGLWATLAYQITGDAKYVELAWSRIAGGFLRKPQADLRGNYSREEFIQLVLIYDWLHPALAPEQRTRFLDQLNAMAESVLTNRWSQSFPISPGDSDQMVGDYFGLAALYAATHEYNPRIAEIWARPYIGGFAHDPAGEDTFRDLIHRYVTEKAAGGEWIEGEGYNIGTVKLLALGAEMVRTATGRDHFPEVTALLPDLALRSIHRLTPDLRQAYQWGDEEHPRDLRLFYRVETAMVLAGLTQSDPEVGPYLQDLVLSLVEKYGPTGSRSAEPWPRGFLVYNPYARRASRTDLPRASYAEGAGMIQYRTGWDESASLFSAHFPPPPSVDHSPAYFGEFQLYRDGEWALTHTLSYDGPSHDNRASNSMLIGGLPTGFDAFREFREVVATDSDDAFAFIAGTTGGRVAAKGAWNAPPTFLREWTRSLVYVPALDALVVHDRVDADDPRRLPMAGYSPRATEAIRSMPALKQWLLHATALPSVTEEGIRWPLPSGTPARLRTLQPGDVRASVLDERQLWPAANVAASEKAYTIRLTPAADRPWDTFLNVVDFGGRAVSARLVSSAGGEAEGVSLAGASGGSVVVLFNARPGPGLRGEPYSGENAEGFRQARLMREPFSVSLEAGTAPVTVYAFHLAPEQSWSVESEIGSTSWSRRPSGVVVVTLPRGGEGRLTFRPSRASATGE